MAHNVIVIIGVGGIGLAVARRQGNCRKVLLADFNSSTLHAQAVLLRKAGYLVETQTVDITSRESVLALVAKARSLGPVTQVVNAAGLSPTAASINGILKVDVYGVGLFLEAFDNVIFQGGAALVISSMLGHVAPKLSREQEIEVMKSPADSILTLPFLNADRFKDTSEAYQYAKYINYLQVQSAAIRWGKSRVRVNSISPGLVSTPSVCSEIESGSVAGKMFSSIINQSPARRMATPDEIASAAAFLLSKDAGFISGTDLLIDGGAYAAMKHADI